MRGEHSPHAVKSHDTQRGTCLLIDAGPPFPSVLYVCICVFIPRSHFIPFMHLISQTECEIYTYLHIIRSEQYFLLQLTIAPAFCPSLSVFPFPHFGTFWGFNCLSLIVWKIVFDSSGTHPI